MPTNTAAKLSATERAVIAAVPEYVSRITPERFAQMGKTGALPTEPPAPRPQPNPYKLNGETVFNEADPRSNGGIRDTGFVNEYRREHPPTVKAFTRHGIRAALAPDSDGRPTGGKHLRGLLMSLTPDEVPAHIREFARFSYYPAVFPDAADAFAPLDADDLKAFIGSKLYRHRADFPQTVFVTETEVKAMKAAYEKTLADRDAAEATGRKPTRETEDENGASYQTKRLPDTLFQP